MNEITRSPAIIGAEIRFITAEAKRMTVVYGAEIGKRLAEAKESVPHGEWGDFLAKETEFSQSAANRFMRLYSEYGQTGILDSNSSTLTNLSISNALALLAVPAEERAEAAEEVKADELSSRELAEALKERDELKRQLKEKENDEEGTALKLAELDDKHNEALERLHQVAHERDELKLAIKELENRPQTVAVEQPDPAEMQAAIDEAVQKAQQEAARNLEKALADAKVAAAKEDAELVEKLEKAQKEAENAKKLAEAAKNTVAVDKLKAEAEEAKTEVERLKKKLAMSDSKTAAFKVHFDAVQRDVEAMRLLLAEMEAEPAEKMRAAFHKLLEVIGGQI